MRLVGLSFVSLNFLWFVLAVVVTYFSVPKRARWVVLLVASYVFYVLVNFWLVIFILFTSISLFFAARYFDDINKKQKRLFADKDEAWLAENKKFFQARFLRKKRIVIWLVLLLNFFFLFLFKYSYVFPAFAWFVDFVNGINARVSNTFSIKVNVGDFDLLMPLGISFYTFQAVGYVADVYRNQQRAERNIFKFALFVSFFPQLVQGPISRFDQLAPQLFKGHDWDWGRIKNGLLLVMWGIFKKLCIAETAYLVYKGILGPNVETFGGAELVVGVLFFMIYGCCDFSGGIDIARGVAQILGVDMVKNFNRPYFATSLRDHWGRWHITLREWNRDYVMYPLTMTKTFNKISRKFGKWFPNNFGKLFPRIVVIFFVYFLIGIWHGPNTKYILFGLYNGTIIAISYFLVEPLRKWGVKHPKCTRTSNKLVKLLFVAWAFVIVFFGKAISASTSMGSAFRLWFRMFTSWGGFSNFWARVGIDPIILVPMLIAFAVLVMVSLFEEIKGVDIRDVIAKRHTHTRWIIYFVFLLMIILFSAGSEGAFLYEKI